MHYGELLKNKAKSLNISPNEIAALTVKNVQTVYADYKKEHLNTEVIEVYCKAMGVTVSELFNENDLSLLEDKKPYYSPNERNDDKQLQIQLQELKDDKNYMKHLISEQAKERQKILDMYHTLVQQSLQQKNDATH